MIMRVNECYNEMKKKMELGSVSWRPEKGHFALEFKATNEITCDYVGDKMYPPSL
jgi:hypothetical protein